MSANVWNEEVDLGLIEELKNTIRIRNSVGELVPLDEEAFSIRKPEEDFKIETYPSVSIYALGESFDARRYNSEPILVSKDEENHTIELQEPEVPFTMNYQVDFWTKYIDDLNVMSTSWLEKHFRQFNLPVVVSDGRIKSCNCLVQGSPVRSDLVLNKERVFHKVFSYIIWVELNSETRYNEHMVTSTKFDV